MSDSFASSRLERLRRLAAAGSAASASPAASTSIPGAEVFTASYAQSRLWFLHQLEPSLTAYHMAPMVWRLSGELDVAALEQALGALIERHSTLRTSFRLQGSEVLQIVHPAGAFELPVEELGERDGGKVIREWQQEESSSPFDLRGGMLLRARLLAVSEREHVLLINHHHIASDGWSVGVLGRDLSELYNAHHSQRPAALQPLKVQYQDYAAWQRQRLSGSRLEALRQYWITQLAGVEPLELPSDRSRPALPSYRGGSVRFQLGRELLEPFEALCRSEGATLQMGVLAVVGLLLHRYSGQEDFAIGVPIWGRNHPDLEELIGFFINTLPVRMELKGSQSFREFLAQVKERSIGAYEHQELPFEQMVEALQVERDTSRNPLVQVMVQLRELPRTGLQTMDGVEVEALGSGSSAARFDLEVFLSRQPDSGIQATLVYARDLFEANRINRLGDHLITLLESVTQAPEAPATTVTLLPEAERSLIESWQYGPENELPQLCVHQLFEQQVERTPNVVAVVFEEQQLSYAELNVRANHLAHHLISMGVGPERIVAVCLERSPQMIVALLAILKVGGVYLPLDPRWPQHRLEHLLGASGACLALVEAASSETGHRLAIRSLNLDSLDLDQASFGTPHLRRPTLDFRAYVIYTSGSTGAPKGVEVEHRTLANLVSWERGARCSLSPPRILQLAASIFDVSLQETFSALTSGGTLFVGDEDSRRDPARLSAYISSHKIDRLYLPAVLLERFAGFVVKHRNSLALGLSEIISAGDRLNVSEPVRQLMSLLPECSLYNDFGPTESHVVSSHQVNLDAVDPTAVVSIGKPISNSTVQILDPSGHLCPIGIPGELHIGGAGLARGYLNHPELTAERFIRDPFSRDPEARLYRSGDLASWNPDGTLAFHGRMDDQIKLRGFRIEPGEIEANLLEHGAVAQAVVVLRQDDPANPRLVGYWVPVPGEGASSQELRGFLAERLPEYMVPAALVELEALPLTGTGKLDRRALPEPSFSGAAEQRVEPSTELERQLHGIWAEVLGHGEFGITDNFFAVGGHSLLTMRLKELVDALAKDDLPLARYFACPTIALFAQYLQQDPGSEGAPGPSASQSTPTACAPAAYSSHGVLPPRIDSFVRQQLVMLERWPGELAPGHQFVRTIAHQEGLPGLFWCFQGANEYESLAEALGPGLRIHGMRSAHGLEGSGQLYLNPALLHHVAELYAREILDLQSPDQPYVVGGNCQAGIIANAVAWHLLAHGRRVRKLILMEPSMSLIRKRILRWSNDTLILYGTDSDLNPFRHPAEQPSSSQAHNGHASPGESSGVLSERLVRRDLGRAFGRKGYAVAFIPGLHGAFFESSNIPGLARAVRSAVLSSSPEPQP